MSAYVIMCNDKPKAVAIGSESFAKDIMWQLELKDHSRRINFQFRDLEEYDRANAWNIVDCKYFVSDFEKNLP